MSDHIRYKGKKIALALIFLTCVFHMQLKAACAGGAWQESCSGLKERPPLSPCRLSSQCVQCHGSSCSFGRSIPQRMFSPQYCVSTISYSPFSAFLCHMQN